MGVFHTVLLVPTTWSLVCNGFTVAGPSPPALARRGPANVKRSSTASTHPGRRGDVHIEATFHQQQRKHTRGQWQSPSETLRRVSLGAPVPTPCPNAARPVRRRISLRYQLPRPTQPDRTHSADTTALRGELSRRGPGPRAQMARLLGRSDPVCNCPTEHRRVPLRRRSPSLPHCPPRPVVCPPQFIPCKTRTRGRSESVGGEAKGWQESCGHVVAGAFAFGTRNCTTGYTVRLYGRRCTSTSRRASGESFGVCDICLSWASLLILFCR